MSGVRSALVAALVLCAAIPAADASYMLAKARLAQVLIERSWNTSGAQPWPWADTAPVARLLIPSLQLDAFVLDGASGATLAFGPGMVSGSAPLGQSGVTMIAAHRDTHFESLQHITIDDVVKIQNSDRQWFKYKVLNIRIADHRTEAIYTAVTDSRMVLVTCYPFNALMAGGPLRFVVEAELIEA